MEKPIADVYLAKWHANFFYLSKSPLKKFFACEIAITNYYDMSNYYDVRIRWVAIGCGFAEANFSQHKLFFHNFWSHGPQINVMAT